MKATPTEVTHARHHTALRTVDAIDASNYVQPGTGNIDLRLKQIVFVPQFAFLFDSWIDLVEIAVQ